MRTAPEANRPGIELFVDRREPKLGAVPPGPIQPNSSGISCLRRAT